MSLYYNNFRYLNKNSLDFKYLDRNGVDEHSLGLIVVSFEPDNGFTDSFLSMTPIQEDYYDGTKKFDYGAKFDSTATIEITVVKRNGTDLSLLEMRELSKWLTGCRTTSWLDVGPRIDDIKYSFLGRVTNLQPYKLDGRIAGAKITFSSITPWAYSSEQVFGRDIVQNLFVDDEGVLTTDNNEDDEIEPAYKFSIDENGVLYNGPADPNNVSSRFSVDDNGLIYMSGVLDANVNNETDDLYSYIYLDIEFTNYTCDYLQIKNETLNEITRVDCLYPEDIIRITNKQFIVAYTRDQITGELINQNRIFGDDFNFIWPRLAPGINNFIIEGGGNGHVEFSYRYPMKVGDCAMDISTYGGDSICGDCDDAPSYDTIRWQDITGTPTTIAGYGITDAYTKIEVDCKILDIGPGIGGNAPTVDGSSVTIDETELNDMLEDIFG